MEEMTISIDPGLKGAIAALKKKNIIEIIDMPTTNVSSKKLVDPIGVSEFINKYSSEYEVTCVIEQVGSSPKMGVSGSFNFGYGLGALRGVVAGLNLPLINITPQKWKAVFGLSKKAKDLARKKVIEMYPEHAALFKWKKDIDRAEAVLIGLASEYLRGM